MKALAKKLGILTVLAIPFLNTSCTTAGSSPTQTVADTTTKPRPEVSRMLRPGSHVTVLKSDGAISTFRVTKVENKVVHGTTATDAGVSMQISEITWAKHNSQTQFDHKDGGIAHSALGAFAKTGQLGGKVALTGIAILGACYGSDPADFIETIW